MILSAFKKGKNSHFFGIKTFTYYIPAPPSRKTGYQEKEFDQTLQNILSLGFELIDIKTQAHSRQDQPGLWIVVILGAPSKKVYQIELDCDSLNSNSSDKTEINIDSNIIHEI